MISHKPNWPLSLLIGVILPVAGAAIADTYQIGGPSCPPPGGQKHGLPPVSIDKDGDGKLDRKYLEIHDRDGNDIQVWCLDHGPYGDYAVYASQPGESDVKIAGCYLVCGVNEWVFETEGDRLKRFRGRNYDRRLPPEGVTKDYEFYFDFDTGEARTVETDAGRPVESRRARLERTSLPRLPSGALAPSFDVPVNTDSFDRFVLQREDLRPAPPAGVGTFRTLDVATFEALSGQHLTPFETEIEGRPRTVEILHHWENLIVEQVLFQADAASLVITMSETSDNSLLTVIIPRELIDSTGENGYDQAFRVLSEDARIEELGGRFEEVATDADRLLRIFLTQQIKDVVIQGNVVGRHVPLPVFDSLVVKRKAQPPAKPRKTSKTPGTFDPSVKN